VEHSNRLTRTQRELGNDVKESAVTKSAYGQGHTQDPTTADAKAFISKAETHRTRTHACLCHQKQQLVSDPAVSTMLGEQEEGVPVGQQTTT
jgi:hypothetical protein